MMEDEMRGLFERFKEECFSDLPSEEAKQKAINAFVFGFVKL